MLFCCSYCYPVHVNGLAFIDTPEHGRLRFSEGATAAEVMYGLCTLFDEDHSLFGGSAVVADTSDTFFYKASKRHEWPAGTLRNCQA